MGMDAPGLPGSRARSIGTDMERIRERQLRAQRCDVDHPSWNRYWVPAPKPKGRSRGKTKGGGGAWVARCRACDELIERGKAK